DFSVTVEWREANAGSRDVYGVRIEMREVRLQTHMSRANGYVRFPPHEVVAEARSGSAVTAAMEAGKAAESQAVEWLGHELPRVWNEVCAGEVSSIVEVVGDPAAALALAHESIHIQVRESAAGVGAVFGMGAGEIDGFLGNLGGVETECDRPGYRRVVALQASSNVVVWLSSIGAGVVAMGLRALLLKRRRRVPAS
ncbi:MAG: hypothetical protein O2819_07870, partial [Planctomycetota bacterium]|nr:hypothetical protein [Planctomycetota bacterium]